MIIPRLNTRKNSPSIILRTKGFYTRRKIIIIIPKMRIRKTINPYHNKKDYEKSSLSYWDWTSKPQGYKKQFSEHLVSLNFHSKVINFVMNYISQYTENMTREKEKDKNIESGVKWTWMTQLFHPNYWKKIIVLNFCIWVAIIIK